MKKKLHKNGWLALLLLTLYANAQIEEGFDDISTLTDYKIINVSDQPGPSSYFQGLVEPGVVKAYEGADDSYIAVNFESTDGTVSDVYLLSPLLTIANGDTISFATRSLDNEGYSDRLEIRIGDGSGTEPTTGDVGAYTNLLSTINPELLDNVYPFDWEVITVTVSGLTAPIQTRVALRYWVTDCGIDGVHGNYIGIDSLSISSDIVLSTNNLPEINFSKFYNSKTEALHFKAASPFKNIQLYNMLGQEIINKTLSSNEEVINISSIAIGTYIARITLENNIQEQFKFSKK